MVVTHIAAISQSGSKPDFQADGDANPEVRRYVSRHLTRRLALASLDEQGMQPRQKLFLLLDDPSYSPAARNISIFIMAIILLSCTSLTLETLPEYRVNTDDDVQPFAFTLIEWLSVTVFTLEYLLRVASVSAMPESFFQDPDDDSVIVRTQSRLEDHLHMEQKQQSRLATVALPGMDDEDERPFPRPSNATTERDDPLAAGAASHGSPVALAPMPPMPPPPVDAEVKALHQQKSDSVGQDETQSTTCAQHMWKIWVFMRQPLNVVDAVAILPFYITLIFGDQSGASSGLAIVRVLRLARVLRIFKLGKYSQSLQTFVRVLKRSMAALYMMIFFVIIAVVLFGSMIYFAEQGTYDKSDGRYYRPDVTGQGREESPFTSIPASFWWVVVTTTTVGYGDLVPTSVWGKLVGAVTMHLGILVLALPITIIGTHFTEEFEEMRREKEREAQEQKLHEKLKGSWSGAVSEIALRHEIKQHDREHNLDARNLNRASALSSRQFASNSRLKASEPISRATGSGAGGGTKAELRALVAQMRVLCDRVESILASSSDPHDGNPRASPVNLPGAVFISDN